MLRKVLRGTIAKLSWLCPKVLPSFSDDAEGKARELILFVQGIDVGKELVHQVLSDDADAGVVLVIGVADVTPLLDLFAADVGEAGSHRAQLDLVDQVAFEARGWAGAKLGQGSDLLVAPQAVPQILVILDADRLIAAPRVQKGLEALRPLELVKHEGVGAEVGDVVGDVEVHAVDDRHDHDQSGGGDDHSEQREEGAKFVAAQRVQGDPESLAGGDPDGDTAGLLGRALLRWSLGLIQHGSLLE